MTRRGIVFSLFVLAVGGVASRADEPPPPATETSGGPYCGVYSLYAALRTVGVPLRFEELLDPKYVGSWDGSSLGELQKAASDFGGRAEAVTGLTAASLVNCSCPVILHVRRPGLKMPYAHWILFLGSDGNQARIVDPPRGVDRIAFAELLSLWDGTGLVVSREPLSLWEVRGPAWLDGAVPLIVVVAVLAFVHHRWRRRPTTDGRPWRAAIGLLGFSLALATAAHALSPDGFVFNRSAVAQVIGRHFEPELATVDAPAVDALRNSPSATLIDARTPRAFAAERVPGAVNLPIHSGLVERSELLATVPKANCVVVYCQSEGCTWGKALASDLIFRGYSDVVLFAGGMNEWERYELAKSRPR